MTLYAPGEAVPPRIGAEDYELMSKMNNLHANQARLAVVSGVVDVTFSFIDLEATIDALSSGDARTLHAVNSEYVPFWCPQCQTSYCGAHWVTWDLFDGVFFDEKRGRCPKGHERRIMD